MIIKWYGTASVSVETEKGKVLFDPFLPLPGSKADTGLLNFRGYRNVVITHAHPDHIGSLTGICGDEKREVYGTDAVTKALSVIGKLRPKKVFVDHFDDTFPPLSRNVDTESLKSALIGKIPVIIPERMNRYDL